MAKSADARDLKSLFRQRECGFKSHPGHQLHTFAMKQLRPATTEYENASQLPATEDVKWCLDHAKAALAGIEE